MGKLQPQFCCAKNLLGPQTNRRSFLSEQLPRLLASRRLAPSSVVVGPNLDWTRNTDDGGSRRYAIYYFEAAAAIMGGGTGVGRPRLDVAAAAPWRTIKQAAANRAGV